MSYIHINNNQINYNDFIEDFNSTYFLTKSNSFQPDFLKWKKKELKLEFIEPNINRFISAFYYLHFEEPIVNYYRFSIKNIEVQSPSIYITFNLYFTKKQNDDIIQSTIEQFTDFHYTSLEQTLNSPFQQFIISSLYSKEVTPDTDKNLVKTIINENFNRLMGRLKTINAVKNSIDTIYDLLTSTTDESFTRIYTIQNKNRSYLIYFISAPQNILQTFSDIFSKTFYSTKIILYYEPLFTFNSQNYIELLKFKYLLQYNNIQANLVLFIINDTTLVYIDKSNIKNALKLSEILEILEQSSNNEYIDYTPLFLLFNKNVREYHEELYHYFIKNNKDLIQEKFYYSKDYSKLQSYSLDTYDVNNQPSTTLFYFVPFMSLGAFSQELQNSWQEIEELWNSYLEEWTGFNQLNIFRKIKVTLEENNELENYILLLNVLEKNGLQYSVINKNQLEVTISDINIPNYVEFLKSKEKILLQYKSEIAEFKLGKIVIHKIKNSQPEISNFIQFRTLNPVYSWILKKQLKELNIGFINFIYYKTFIIFITKNIELKKLLDNLEIVIQPFIKSTLPIPDCSNDEDEISHKKFKIMTDIERMNLIKINNRCYSLDSVLDILETSKRENSLPKVKNHLLTKNELLEIYKRLLTNIDEQFILEYLENIDTLNISNYKLDIVPSEKSGYLDVFLNSKNKQFLLIVVPKEITIVNKIFNLWKNKKLLPVLAYKLNNELGYIPDSLIKINYDTV